MSSIFGNIRESFRENEQSLLGGMATAGHLISGISRFTAPDVDYDKLKLTSSFKKLQARQLEIESKQIANQLRQQFTERAGQYQAIASQRGVKVGEGSAGVNVEQSARALGKDVQTLESNAKYQAGTLRREAKDIKATARGVQKLGGLRRAQGLMGSLSKAHSSYTRAGGY